MFGRSPMRLTLVLSCPAELVATIPPTSLYFVADTVEVFQTPTLCASASDACIFIDGKWDIKKPREHY